MSAATLNEILPAGSPTEALSQEMSVGPNSKLIGAVASLGSGTPDCSVQAFFFGQWFDVSAARTTIGLFDFDGAGLPGSGNLPAGTRIRVRVNGTFTNANISLMTS